MHRSDARPRSSRPRRRCAAAASTRSPSTTSTALVAALADAGYKRDTISKSRDALAQALDHCGVDPNPARDKRVKLPKERKPHVPPPLAEHVERVAERLPRDHVLPLLIIDECGPRVNELATAEVGDLDEHRKAIRVRWTVEKNDRYRHLDLPDDLFDALRRDAAAARGSRPRRAAVPRPDRRAAPDGDHEGVQGDRDAALLPARPPPPARVAALQAHRLARRRRGAARRLEAGRGRPLRLRAHRLPRGRLHRARPRRAERVTNLTPVESDSRQGDPREELDHIIRSVREHAEPPVPELIAWVVLDARARRVPAYKSQVNVRVQGGQRHEVYSIATSIIGNCLSYRLVSTPEIVPS